MITHIWSVTLTVSDLERAVRFYATTLGLPLKYKFKDYAGFDCGGVEIGLKTWGELQPPRAGEPNLDLTVDDVDQAYAELTAKGEHFTGPPADTQWGARIANFHDPDGNSLQLTQIDWPRYLHNAVPR